MFFFRFTNVFVMSGLNVFFTDLVLALGSDLSNIYNEMNL